MRGNQAEISFEKVVLTKDMAQQLGHVAWIEEDNPIAAISQMRQAVSVKPFNMAV